MGEILTTGNTVVDAAKVAAKKIAGAREAQIALRLGLSNTKRPKILFTMHRRESHGQPVRQVFQALREIASENDVEILFPVHPNPNIHGPAHAMLGDVSNIHLLNPLDYDEVIFSLKNARILVTDSGGLAEEAPTFGTPALILRESTERPESIDAGGAVLIGYDTDRLKSLVRDLLADGETYRSMAAAPNPFGDGKASLRICDVLAGPAAKLARAA
jgi:UDP-N-acetylglucosamine 2-epimerase (non-hydrolysing)